MRKRITSVLIAVVFMFVFIGLGMAAGGKGNPRKGKYLYRKNCRTCHKEGGSAKALSPIDMTQAEWKKVFDGYKNLKCKAEWEKLSEKDMTDVFSYLHGHAKDSPSPAKCQ